MPPRRPGPVHPCHRLILSDHESDQIASHVSWPVFSFRGVNRLYSRTSTRTASGEARRSNQQRSGVSAHVLAIARVNARQIVLESLHQCLGRRGTGVVPPASPDWPRSWHRAPRVSSASFRVACSIPARRERARERRCPARHTAFPAGGERRTLSTPAPSDTPRQGPPTWRRTDTCPRRAALGQSKKLLTFALDRRGEVRLALPDRQSLLEQRFGPGGVPHGLVHRPQADKSAGIVLMVLTQRFAEDTDRLLEERPGRPVVALVGIYDPQFGQGPGIKWAVLPKRLSKDIERFREKRFGSRIIAHFIVKKRQVVQCP